MSVETAEDAVVFPCPSQIQPMRSLSYTPSLLSTFDSPMLAKNDLSQIQTFEDNGDGSTSFQASEYLTDTDNITQIDSTLRDEPTSRDDTDGQERWIIPPPPPPPLDRINDLMTMSSLPVRPILYPEGASQHIHSLVNNQPLFSLPAAIRRRIYSFCFPNETRQVTLSPRFATKAAFENGYFILPWTVLEYVQSGLEACRALRNDLWIYFWTEFHFHITLSTVNGPRFSPLSHIWVKSHLSIIQHLTVELDCTRFGEFYMESTPDSNYNMKKIELLLAGIIKRIIHRKDNSTISEFNILCRHYAGFHPYIQRSFVDKFGPDADPGCSDTVLHIGHLICGLRGVLQKCRIAGFPATYTKMLLSALFASGDAEPKYIIPEEPAWPPLPLQSVSTSFSSTFTPSWTRSSSFELKLRESSSLAKEYERHPRNYADSPSCDSSSSSSYSTADDDRSDEEDDGNIDELLPCEAGASIPRWTWQYRDLVLPFSEFGNPDDCPPPDLESYGPLSNHSQLFRGDSNSEVNVALGLGIERFKTPSTLMGLNPNDMNEINEQDPAFLRSLGSPTGLRNAVPEPEAFKAGSVDESRKLIMDNQDPDDSCGSGTSINRREIVKQKSNGLLRRLRGKTT